MKSKYQTPLLLQILYSIVSKNVEINFLDKYRKKILLVSQKNAASLSSRYVTDA